MLPTIRFSRDCDNETTRHVIENGLRGILVTLKAEVGVETEILGEGIVISCGDYGLTLARFDIEAAEVDYSVTDGYTWGDYIIEVV